MTSFSFFSPGRINLIGEHIDYNGGSVLPATIDLGICFSVKQRKDDNLSIRSDIDRTLHFLKGSSEKEAPFLRYLFSVLETKPSSLPAPKGWHFELTSTLPAGAGLSSSSALTCGFIYALLQIEEVSLDPQDMIAWAVRAEHGTGVIGGHMDQTSIFLGQKDHFLHLDCSSAGKKFLPFQSEEVAFLLFDLQLPHQLVHSEYNERRKVCEKIVSLGGPSPYLAKWSSTDLQNHYSVLSKWEYDMGCFVIEEEARVTSAVKALEGQDWKTLGKIMSDTHNGLRDQYRVSLPEIDTLQSRLVTHPDVLGARIMGGGFGGCVLGLVAKEGIPLIKAWSRSELSAMVYPVRFAHGLLQTR